MNQGESGAEVQVRRWLEAANSFYGTLMHTNWAGDVTVYGPGTYADSGWVSAGQVSYGSTVTHTATANYTGGSGGYYSSSAGQAYGPDVPTWSPNPPTGVSARRSSDTSAEISWNNRSTAARRYASQAVQRSTDGGEWVTVSSSLSGAATSYTDSGIEAGHRYAWRVAGVNSANTSWSGSSGYVYTTPSDPSACSAARASDSRIDVSWTPVGPAASRSGFRVERSVDGGAWSQVAELGPSATSWSDTSTSAAHRYRYRARAYNPTSASGYATSGTVYTTPSTPASCSSSRASDTRNDVSWNHGNSPSNVDGFKIERSVDGGAWTQVGTAGASATSWSDTSTSAAHRYRYRVRAYKGPLNSGYATSGTTYNTPSAPTSCSAARQSDSRCDVSWRHANSTSNIDGFMVERSVDGGAWSQVAEAGASATSWSDTSTSATHRYQYRIRAHKGTLYSGYATSGAVYTTPSAPTSCSSSRASDTRNDVSWNHGNSPSNVDGFKVERSTDGGAWSQVGTASASATSYADTATSANHSYAYRVRAYKGPLNSGYATSGTTYNTPSAPSVTGVARTGETTVLVSLSNPGTTATSLELQRSQDRSQATTLPAVPGRVDRVTDNPGGGTFYYRARNRRGELASAWSAWSDGVTTVCPPAAPTPVYPESSEVVPTSRAHVDFRWLHNPLDGSAQEAAQVEVAWGGGSRSLEAGAAQTARCENDFGVNASPSWRVRTMGVSGEWGPWSSWVAFRCYQEPSLHFTSPDGTDVERVPISVELAYSDASGSLSSLEVEALDGRGERVWSRSLGRETSCTVERGEWLPEDGADYTLVARATSTSSLSASCTVAVPVRYNPPDTASVVASDDPETGMVTVTVEASGEPGAEKYVSVDLYRVNPDGSLTSLAVGIGDGTSVTDRHAPLNTDYAYRAVAFAESGSPSSLDAAHRVRCPRFCAVWDGGVATARLDPSWTRKTSRPERTLVRYAGRKMPVAYDSDAASVSHSLSATMESREQAEGWEEMVMAGGPCVFKTPMGDVFWAAVDADTSPLLRARDGSGAWGTLRATVTRVDGGQL